MKKLIILLSSFAIFACADKSAEVQGDSDTVSLAFVSNGVNPFWDMAAKGVKDASEEFNATTEVLLPPEGITDQKRMIEAALTKGVQGIAMSPIDAVNQESFINEVAAITPLITQDSDAPNTNRLCFIGMNNYLAGRAAGKMIKEVAPEGGEVMMFVGRLEQLNSQQRRQGVIDELFDRPEQALLSMSFDPNDGAIVGSNYTILDTRTDNFDYSRAKSNAEDAITAYPNLKVMVGLFVYNTPSNLGALREADKLGEVKLVSFDEADETLQGILDGHVQGTISQQPYQYGYESVRILSALARGDNSVLPESGFLEVPIIEVRKENAQTFWDEVKALQTK